MPFRQPLTAEELAAISARYAPMPTRAPSSFPESAVWPDVLTLLFEIKRMRSMLLTAHRFKAEFHSPSMCLDEDLKAFRLDLDREPCVVEFQNLKIEILNPDERPLKRGHSSA